VDVLGISMSGEETKLFAIDVTFHEGGLNYGDRQETVSRVMKKLIRTVLRMEGYFKVKKGEIIFAAPKIHNAVFDDLKPCVEDLNKFLQENQYEYTARIIANEDSTK